MKQDRTGIRNHSDTELQIAALLKKMDGTVKAQMQSEKEIIKTNKILEDFSKEVLESLQDMQDQIDGVIENHFYEGAPTLDTLPASEWITEQDKADHLGDLYYDQDTGAVYRFVVTDGVYGWLEIPDTEVAQALAMANAAKDTADSKRRVFLDVPIPPYDSGDIWLKEGELWRCQITKSVEQSYEEMDFIVATKYTDDTEAIKTTEDLKVLRGTVTEIKAGTDQFQINIEQKVNTLDSNQKEIQEVLKKTSYTFGTEDLHITKTGEPLSTRVSHNGMRVQYENEDRLVANDKGVEATNLHAKTHLIIGSTSRFEDSNGRTCCFWIGG